MDHWKGDTALVHGNSRPRKSIAQAWRELVETWQNMTKAGKALVIIVVAVIAFAGIAADHSSNQSTSQNLGSPSEGQSNGMPATAEELSKIEVKCELQDSLNEEGKQKFVVWVTNNSSYTFTGSFEAFAVNGSERMGGDIVFVDNLPPAKRTYAILWVNLGATSYEVTDLKGEFGPQ